MLCYYAAQVIFVMSFCRQKWW